MSKKNKSETLADKISNILSTTPSSFDPEEDIAEETAAKVTENAVEDDEDEVLLSKFRKQNIDLLEDIDVKYAGRKSSRKDLRDSDDEQGSFGSDTENDNDASDTNSSVNGRKDSEPEEDKSDSRDEEVEASASGEDLSGDDSNFTHIQDGDVHNQLKRGLCVRNQLNIWESLMEVRIQLQKCLLTANKFPQKETFNEIKNESGELFTSKVAESKKNISSVLDKLLLLRTLLLRQYPESKSLFKKSAAEGSSQESDEEIRSDTDEETLDNEAEEDSEIPRKKRKLTDYERDMAENHKKYTDYRNSVIQKWNDKTRIAVAKKNNTTHSILDQINHNLCDTEKLLRRTRTKRSEYKIVGKKEPSGDEQTSSDAQVYDVEIFDDDDFYHQLLRELIEVKSADITDPVQLGRQWIQLQNLRSKMKRKIDTKATKGRRIRYTVHSKLVNFMAPIDQNLWTDEARTELFSSLFGRNQPVHTV